MPTLSKKPNHLINEKSPYLLQHAYNPVDWYPWGPQAFEKARKENKPIFLSIGYSTCHWCHVMAHESFEDSNVAAILNERYVAVKVDREERPDVDHLYMTTVQLLTGGGGWPMSVWLTPDLKPFYGGTYFPLEDRAEQPGFKSILRQIAEIWDKENSRIIESAKEITDAMQKAIQAEKRASTPDLQINLLMESAFQSLRESFDDKDGGFGPPPKFPMPGYLNFLLYYFRLTHHPQALNMVGITMRKIAQGGITDQLGGGFARYSTDRRWIVPHFEKMLYDNAQLISVCLSLFLLTDDSVYRNLALEAVRYVLRDLTHPGGGFYSAEDADSEGREGTFYLWTAAEIEKILGPELAEKALFFYGVTPEGNYHDPHTGEPGKNILLASHSVGDAARRFKTGEEEMKTVLSSLREKLFLARAGRVRPHRDDKILTQWNGLMISALARAGALFGDDNILSAAQSAAVFIRDHLFDAKKKILYRRWREGEIKVPAFQADYACLTQGLLDLFQAAGDPRWFQWAIELQEEMNRMFFDDQDGGYFMSAESSDLVLRLKEESDNVIPSGQSVAALNGIRLGRLLDRNDFLSAAKKTVESFEPFLKSHILGALSMLTAASILDHSPLQVVVVGQPDQADTRGLLFLAHRLSGPGAFIIPVRPGADQEEISRHLPWIKNMAPLHGRAMGYVCTHFACEAPTADPAVFAEQLTNATQKQTL